MATPIKENSMRRVAISVLLVLLAAAPAAAQPTPETTPKPALTASPVEVIDRLAKSKLVPVEPFAGAERTTLEAAWAARTGPKAKPLPQADAAALTAHLRAGGVTDPAAIAGYVKKFDVLVADAEAATRDAKTARDKADQLLRFLHKGVMAKGYAEDQTSLHAVFDTGKYNCVSSAALYYLVGTRLGLDLVGISIPSDWMVAGHAAADLVDGKARVQVEPTNADGFEADVKAKRPGVIVLGIQPDRKKGRDCDGYGLAAAAASNLGVSATKAKPPRRAEAIRWYAHALALDPTDKTALQNLTAEFSNWGVAAAKAGEFEEAVAVYAFALGVLADGKGLRQNHTYVWGKYLDAEFDAGRYESGAKVLARAAKAVPEEYDFTKPGVWPARAAQRAVDKDGWAAGQKVAEDLLKTMPMDAAKVIREWKDGSRRRWSQHHLEKGEIDESLKIIGDGLAADPDNRDLKEGLAVHTLDAMAHLVKTKGVKAAGEHLAALRKQFPKYPVVNEAAQSHAYRAIEKLSDTGKYAESVKLAEEYKDFAAKPGELTDLAYRWWGRALAKDKKWDDALAKFAEGLKVVPKGEHVTSAVEQTVDEWADAAIDKKDWAGAIRVYDAGLKVLPDSRHLKHNKSVCEERRGK
ncbi:MAG: hypothetical protein C0467_01575 [Planctomycetaceae bacterium]|nr:hypothetical protein [Planctomycetaceae bacterium]